MRNGLRLGQRLWRRGRCRGDTDGRARARDWNGYREGGYGDMARERSAISGLDLSKKRLNSSVAVYGGYHGWGCCYGEKR